MENKTLFTIYNEKEVEISISEIFDHNKFNRLRAVTYSIDSSFCNSYLKQFKKTELIVGIQDDKVQQRTLSENEIALRSVIKTSKLLNSNFSSTLLESFSRTLQEKVCESQFSVLVPVAKTIHTKLYLMDNEETGETRIVIGSANLSNQAFSNNSNQFELIEIRDNSELFDSYSRYFDEKLRPETKSIWEKDLIKKVEVKLKETDEPVSFTPLEVEGIKLSNLSGFYADLQNRVDKKIVDQDFIDFLKEESKNETSRIEESKKDFEDFKIAVKITSTVVNRSTGRGKAATKLHDSKKLSSKLKTLQDYSIQTKRATAEIAERDIILNKPNLRSDVNSGILIGKNEVSSDDSTGNKEKTINFTKIGKHASDSEIKNQIKALVSLINNYKDFVPNYNANYGKRVMEAILYSFTSPFISEIRKNFTQGNQSLDVPLFAIIGGTGGSGKSNLLNIINKMMGIGFGQKALTYNELINDSGPYKKSNTLKQIRFWMLEEENVAPLMVDELPSTFFGYDKKGEDLIKDVSNQAENSSNLTPAFICTTNADELSAKSEALTRRIYFLLNDRKFDSSKRKESTERYIESYNSFDTSLFEDFLIRFSKIMLDDNLDWNQYSNGKIDFLYYSREIFKTYFEIAGIDLPDWFPTGRVDDSSQNNKMIWRKLYSGAPELFKETEDLETGRVIYTVRLSELDKNFQKKSNYSQEDKPSLVYSEALDNTVLCSTLSKNDLFAEIFVDEFHNWIGIKKDKKSNSEGKSKTKNFFSKLFG